MSRIVADQNLIVDLPQELQRQLKMHALEIKRKEEEQMREKLQREYKKNSRIQEIQSNFVKWAEKKSMDNQVKFQKIEKNKEDYLAKIVKKCKDRDKFVAKKHDDFNKTRKKNLNVAWKKAEQFNDDIKNYYKSKHLMSRTAKAASGASLREHHSNNTEEIQKIERQTEKVYPAKLNNNSININSSQIYLSQKNNASLIMKDSTGFKPNLKESRNERFIRVQSTSLDEVPNSKGAIILEKLRQINQDNQKKRIQQFGQKMQKIQQSRAKREKNHEKKESKQQGQERSRNLTKNEFRPKKSPKKNKQLKRDERLYSEQSYKKQSRLKDRMIDAKVKRNEMLEQHLAEGDDYIENLKIRHLKNVIAKNISYNMMEKKLYLERLNN